MTELATLVCAVGIAVLFWLDRDSASDVSRALWLPFAWMFLAGSRMVTEWLYPGAPEATDVLYDGSPVDRFVVSALLVLGLAVLIRRAPRVNAILRANWPILLFFAFAAFSVVWSDFPDVAIKRWIKACGNVVMVLVVLTEANPAAAVKRLFARLAFVLLPLSILLIRYYPSLGRGYHEYSWQTFYSGVATGKNGLGYICLVLGLASAWRLLETRRWRWSTEDWTDAGVTPAAMRQTRHRILLAHGIVLAFALWLFRLSDSVTPLVCCIVATTLMMVAGSQALARRPTGLHVVFVTALLVLLPGWVMFDVFTEAFGRDTTLTGRTELWRVILRVAGDPMLGSGFESFWLGDRMQQIGNMYWWRPNQAHNGYLEIYLNLGLIGVALLGLVVVRGYSSVIRTLHYDPEFGRLKLGFLTAAVLYNLTEAAFKGMHLVWIAFFFATIHVPWRTSETSEPTR